MTSIVIRDVPQEVHDVLVTRAKAEGRSLQQYALRLISDSALHRTQAEVLEEIRQTAATMPAMSTEQILAELHASRDDDAA